MRLYLAALLLSGCAATHSVSIAAQHATVAIDSVKKLADTFQEHIEQAPQYTPEGQIAPTSPLDVIVQALPTFSVNVVSAAKTVYEVYKALKGLHQKGP